MLREEDVNHTRQVRVGRNQYSYSRAKAQQKRSGVGYAEAKSMYMTAEA